jgi:Ca-activated chloride channel family protein
MNVELITILVLLLAGLAEWLHARRCRRVAVLAFGPSGKPRQWTTMAPVLRVGALALLTWGLMNLFLLDPRVLKPKQTPEGGYRHLVIALDVSPSMQLKDAGPTAQMTRAQRASEILTSVLERSALEQMRVSIVAFYTGAKPVVVDTYDLEVVKNILNDLPLDIAFDIGKTTLLDGIKESFELAKPWKPKSTTLLMVSDGDTVGDIGMPPMPASIGQVVVIGVGDTKSGIFIDGHQSRQDASTLRQVATRLRGVYHDGNEKHLPSNEMAALSKVVPLQDDTERGKRELSVAAVAGGATVLAGLPIALAMAGSAWQSRTVTKRIVARAQPTRSFGFTKVIQPAKAAERTT